MKKFISLMTAVVILFSVSSCREEEEFITLSETNRTTIYQMKKDSLSGGTEYSSTNSSNSTIDEKDPPQKDKIEW